MAKKISYHPKLADDLDILLAELCREWDFCAGVTGDTLLKSDRRLTAKRFTDTLILAEGMTLENEANWIRRIKRRFVQRYGHVVSLDDYNP